MTAATGKGEPRTALDLWRSTVAGRGDRIAYRHHDGRGWAAMTWREADREARSIAAGLAALGVGAGDRVCLLSQIRLEWILCDVGILLAGGVTVPIYASSTPDQVELIVNDAGAKLVIVEDAVQLEKLAAVRPRLPGVARVIAIAGDVELEKPDARGRKRVALADAAAGLGDWQQPLSTVRQAGAKWSEDHPAELGERAAGVQPGSTFTIVYTSGTTGLPKGAVLTHEALAAACGSAIRAMTLEEGDEGYLFLPLAHILSRELEWAAVEAGVSTWISRGMTSIKADLAEIRPTFMAGVPRIFEKLHAGIRAAAAQASPVKRRMLTWGLEVGARWAAAARAGRSPGAGLRLEHGLAERLVLRPLRARLGLDRIRLLLSGGAPLSPDIAEFFHGVGLLILEGYGLTETMAAIFLNRADRYRFGTVGPALDVVEAKLAEDGEILVRGPSIFKGYFNNPAATAEAIDPQGWFHTGDVGILEDGLLRITDRKKDIIVTAAGKKVAPQALEGALKARTSLVSQAVVLGDRRPYCVALVTLSDEAKARFGREGEELARLPEVRRTVANEIEALNATLAPFETIKRFAILPHDFTEASGELTPSLKVKRKVVADRYGAEVAGLYAEAAGEPGPNLAAGIE